MLGTILYYIQAYFVRFVVISIAITLLSQLFYAAILTALVYKQNFIYMMSTSQLTGKLSIWGFCFFIFMLFFAMSLQLKNIFK